MNQPNQWMYADSPRPKKFFGVFGSIIFEILHAIFRFFSSVKLAVTIIASLIVILATGTIVESLHGADAAKIVVYDTPWFSFVLVMLGMNVFVATLDRLPWQKKHIGFLITHLGILLILAGSFITRFSMIDGQMPVAEGETEGHLTLSEPLLYIYSESLRTDWVYPIPKKAFAWEGREKLETNKEAGHEVYLLHYFPKARMRSWIEPAPTGPAAIRVRLKSSFVDQDYWLIIKDPEKGKIALGPADIVFTDKMLPETQLAKPKAKYFEFQFKEQTIEVPIPEESQLPFTTSIPDTPYQMTVTRLLKNAVVKDNKLEDQVEGNTAAQSVEKNPAAELILKGNDLEEFHTVFARFPEFPTQHGMKPSAAGVRIFYKIPGTNVQTENRELRFVQKENGELVYQVKNGTIVTAGKVMPGTETPLGWMDFKFTVQDYYPHSTFRRDFSAQPNISEATDLVTAAEIEIRKGTESHKAWLGQGVRAETALGGDDYQMIFGQKRLPLGFKLELKDFKMENYPGTAQPARYSSDVVLKDDTRGISRDVHISMNEPLEYRGFKIYQSAYSLEPGGPEVSIFAVGKDPGVPVKYVGAFVLISGTIIIFSQRKFRKRSES